MSDTKSLQLSAPGKINLFLELLARRDDGFHELVTVMTPVNVRDTLRVRLRDDDQVSVESAWLPSAVARARRLGVPREAAAIALPASRENLVSRALRTFQRETGFARGFEVRLQKRIPAAAGMGGASADAATALLAAAALADNGTDLEQLRTIAATLGSDIPFFLGDRVPASAALLTGRGDQSEPFRAAANLWFVIAYPPETCATSEVYARCHVPEKPVDVTPLLTRLRTGRIASLPRLLLNRLELPARQTAPAICDTLKALATAGSHPRVTGSGSACFAIARNARTARRASRRLAARLRAEVFCTNMALMPARS